MLHTPGWESILENLINWRTLTPLVTSKPKEKAKVVDLRQQTKKQKQKKTQKLKKKQSDTVEKYKPFESFSNERLNRYYAVCIKGKADMSYGRAGQCREEMIKRGFIPNPARN